MKILIVSNEYDKPGRLGNPIIGRIIDSLQCNKDVEKVFFTPFKNQFSSFLEIRNAAKKADIIHIQFGGIYAFLIWLCLIGVRKPRLLTFHGTDIHAKEIKTTKSMVAKMRIKLNQYCSFASIIAFDKLGFVSSTLYPYIPKWLLKFNKNKMFVQPLGVDYKVFKLETKENACLRLGITPDKYVLFSDKSNTTLKRRDIAESIVTELGGGYTLLYMCGVKPDDVPHYINASEFVLLTSDEEGSPNIIREALSLNKRVFSVEVGDVRQQIEGLKDSAIISRDAKSAAKLIKTKLQQSYSDDTRETLRYKIDFEKIADKMVSVYSELLKD